MFGLGMGELLIIGLVVALFFGARKIPEFGSALAKGIKNFQDGLSGNKDKKKLEDKDPPSGT